MWLETGGSVLVGKEAMQSMSGLSDDDLAMIDAEVNTRRRPTTPGDVLRQEILEQHKITQDDLAAAMKVSRYTINQLVNDRRSLTAEMALRLGVATSTSPQFWLNLQRAVDLFDARAELGEQLKKVRVILPPQTEEVFTSEAELN
jgi:addiction module HigA family antidote